MEKEKCVVVLNGELPLGLLVNTAAILGVSLGEKRPDVVGVDARTADGCRHSGVIRFPIPILKSDESGLRALRERLREVTFAGLTVLDFTTLAQGCKTYDAFIDGMAASEERELRYTGLAICGDRRSVDRLTGNLPLLR